MDARQMLRWLCLPIALIVLGPGCVTPDPSVDLLEGELRWMEDQLYMLEDELQQKCDQLAACRQGSTLDGDHQRPKPARPWNVPQLDSETLPPPSIGAPEIIRSPDASTPANTPSHDASDRQQGNSEPDGPEWLPDKMDDFDLGVPEIVLPQPEAIRGERPQFETPPTPHPADAQPPADTEGGSAEFQATPLLLGKAVHHIKLNAKRFSSHNTISDQDEEKLLVVVEPLSEQNEYIELSAPMTVLVEDADKEGSSASLGRWEFNALQTGRTLRESKMGRGIHLNLDWPRDLPLVDNLRVSVTYATLDGTQLEAEELLHSDSQKNSIAGWTPVAKSRQQTVVGQPKNDPFMLTEQDQEQSVGAVFKTVPIPAEPTPAINTPVKLVSHDANAASTRQIDGAVIQSVEFEETAADEPLALPRMTATNTKGGVAKPTWQPYR
jgi:hypothetical protein